MIVLIIPVIYRLIIIRSIGGEDFHWDFLISSGAHIPIMDSIIIIMDIMADITADITAGIMAGIMGVTPPIIDQGLADL